MTSDPTREQGIDFHDLTEELRSVEYPATTDELCREHGDHELGLVDGSTTLREALTTLEGATFSSPDGVRRAVKNVVGADAVGREGYTDRGGEATTDLSRDQSF